MWQQYQILGHQNSNPETQPETQPHLTIRLDHDRKVTSITPNPLRTYQAELGPARAEKPAYILGDEDLDENLAAAAEVDREFSLKRSHVQANSSSAETHRPTSHKDAREIGRRTVGWTALSFPRFNSYSRPVRGFAVAFSALGGIGAAVNMGDRVSVVDEARAQTSSDNEPPVANFNWKPSNTSDTYPNVNDEVVFDAAWSQDPDGLDSQEMNYLWDLDNDEQYDDASGQIVTYKFTTIGVKYVSLHVTDPEGATDTFERSLFVFGGPNTCFSDEQGHKICNYNTSQKPGTPPGTSAAKQCIDSTIDKVRIIPRRRGEGRIRGKKSMRVWVEGKDGATTASGEKCDKVLTTAKVWQVQERNMPSTQGSRRRGNGRLSRNSNIAKVVSNRSAAFGKYVRLKLRDRYTCEPGSGKRGWGLRLRISSKSGSETQTVTKKVSSRRYRSFTPC